jgi:hypothetical protein
MDSESLNESYGPSFGANLSYYNRSHEVEETGGNEKLLINYVQWGVKCMMKGFVLTVMTFRVLWG